MSFTAKPPYSGLVVNVFNGLFTLPTIHRCVALWNVDLLKGQSPKISDSTCLTSWSTIFLTRSFVHLMWLPPERNHLLSDMFWVIIRNYVHLFWKLEVPPWHLWTWYVSLFPNGNLRPTWLVQLLGGSQINRNLENPNLILVLPSCSLVGFTWSNDGLRIMVTWLGTLLAKWPIQAKVVDINNLCMSYKGPNFCTSHAKYLPASLDLFTPSPIVDIQSFHRLDECDDIVDKWVKLNTLRQFLQKEGLDSIPIVKLQLWAGHEDTWAVKRWQPMSLTEVCPIWWAPRMVNNSGLPRTMFLCESQALTCLPP